MKAGLDKLGNQKGLSGKKRKLNSEISSSGENENNENNNNTGSIDITQINIESNPVSTYHDDISKFFLIINHRSSLNY